MDHFTYYPLIQAMAPWYGPYEGYKGIPSICGKNAKLEETFIFLFLRRLGGIFVMDEEEIKNLGVPCSPYS